MDDLEPMDLQGLIDRIGSQHFPTLSNPVYACPECQDEGFIHTEVDGYRSCRKCKCLIAKDSIRRIRNSGLGHVLDAWTMDAFTANEPYQAKMKGIAEHYIAAVKSGGKPWLFMGGAVGSGKSHLCTAVCGELLRDRFTAKYFQWLTDARRMKSNANEQEEYEEALDEFMQTDILYVDDLFKSKRSEGDKLNPSDADVRLAFEILNGRYVANKITIVSSEWLMDDLLALDEGTFSRVYEKSKGYRVEVKREAGRNYRMAGKGE